MTTTRRARATPGDAGLGLVEVVVSMLVLTVVLLALVPVQTRALASVALSEERQQATAHAARAIEQVRASPFAAVAAGRAPSSDDAGNVLDASTCSPACTFKPSFDATVPGEVLKVTASPHASLLTERCSEASGCTTTGSVSGLAFVTRLYVTSTSDARLVTVTAVTTWVSGGGERHVAVRTQVAAPVTP